MEIGLRPFAAPTAGAAAARIALDEKGFVATGEASGLPSETSSPGVFAIGDARSASIKRVAAGVREGAAAVTQIHVTGAGSRRQTGLRGASQAYALTRLMGPRKSILPISTPPWRRTA
jgi:pyruvate/2-oxoglutarate dehydrogenase complex dihydrolipoamide dehydrogenase (E3) component